MGIEFKLGRQDHKKVEDFLGRRPAGVDAITIDVNHVSYQAERLTRPRRWASMCSSTQ